MKISEHTPSLSAGYAYGLQKRAEKQPEAPPAATQTGETAQAGGADEYQGQRGVIRNLLDGHYKGVADVRLRINFYDELASLEAASVGQALGQETAGLQDFSQDLAGLAGGLEGEALDLATGLSGSLDSLLENPPLSGEDAEQALEAIREQFAALLAKLNEPPAVIPPQEEGQEDQEAGPEAASGEDSPPQAASLGTELLDDLAPSPEPALAEAGVEAPAEPAAQAPLDMALAGEQTGAEGGEEAGAIPPDPAVQLADFLEKWQTAFAQMLDALEGNLSGVSSLPPLSGPGGGNGKAYAKFLAIYQSLSAPAEPDPGQAASVDTSV